MLFQNSCYHFFIRKFLSISFKRPNIITFIIIAILFLLVTAMRLYSTKADIAHIRMIDKPNSTDNIMLVTAMRLATNNTTKIAPMRLATNNNKPAIASIRLVDKPNSTDSTMKSMLKAYDAVAEAQRIQLQIYRELIGHYKKAILVGIADHNNLGDSAISVGEFEALAKLDIKIIYYCPQGKCSTFEEARRVVNEAREPVVILASGGGNFCIWITACTLRENLIRAFPDKEVIIFPQSVHFNNSTKQMQAHADIMNTHPNITYLFRDHQSYDIIVNSGMFKYNRAVLCPDAALQIGAIQPPNEPTHDIVFLKRWDEESFHSELPEFPPKLKIIAEDWLKMVTLEGKDLKATSYRRLRTAVEFLSRGKVVISDRLHAHIISVLLGKPNVMLDNSYKKLSSFHSTWTPSVDNVLFAANVTDSMEKAQYLLQKYY